MTKVEYALIEKALVAGAHIEHNHREGFTCDEAKPCLFCRAQAALKKEAKRNRSVVIEVRGGVAECTHRHPTVRVEIIDHDNESAG
jgi:hypothetical protein